MQTFNRSLTLKKICEWVRQGLLEAHELIS
jgi:hypothetical protein